MLEDRIVKPFVITTALTILLGTSRLGGPRNGVLNGVFHIFSTEEQENLFGKFLLTNGCRKLLSLHGPNILIMYHHPLVYENESVVHSLRTRKEMALTQHNLMVGVLSKGGLVLKKSMANTKVLVVACTISLMVGMASLFDVDSIPPYMKLLFTMHSWIDI